MIDPRTTARLLASVFISRMLRMVTSPVAHNVSPTAVEVNTSAAATVMVLPALSTRPWTTSLSPFAGAKILIV